MSDKGSKTPAPQAGPKSYARMARPGEIGVINAGATNSSRSLGQYDFVYTPPSGTLDVATSDKKTSTEVTGAGSEGMFAQLLSRGPQDVYLTYNPEMTFFKRLYKRYTNFAVEQSEERCSTTVRFGTKNTITVSKRGHLVGSMILRIVLPNLNIAGGTWKQTMGYNILDSIDLRIGDTTIQTTGGLWLDIDDKLFCPDSKYSGLDKLIRRGETLATNQSHELLIPLKFLCCKNTTFKQQYIPIVGLANNIHVYVDFTLKTLSSLVNMPPGGILPDGASPQAGLIVEYIFLDKTERHTFARADVTLMIEQVYSIDKKTYLTTTNGQTSNQSRIDISLRELNKPVKYFAIVAYPESDFTGFEYSNIFKEGTFYLNSNPQFSQRSSEYFTLIQPYQHGRRCQHLSNILMFSFSLDATSFQPNGALNFASYTNSNFSFDIIPQEIPKKVKVFAVALNWVTFEHGMCRLLFV